MPRIVVPLKAEVWPQLKLLSQLQQTLLKNFVVVLLPHDSLHSDDVARAFGPKSVPQHDWVTTMLDHGDSVSPGLRQTVSMSNSSVSVSPDPSVDSQKLRSLSTYILAFVLRPGLDMPRLLRTCAHWPPPCSESSSTDCQWHCILRNCNSHFFKWLLCLPEGHLRGLFHVSFTRFLATQGDNLWGVQTTLQWVPGHWNRWMTPWIVGVKPIVFFMLILINNVRPLDRNAWA